MNVEISDSQRTVISMLQQEHSRRVQAASAQFRGELQKAVDMIASELGIDPNSYRFNPDEMHFYPIENRKKRRARKASKRKKKTTRKKK